MGNSLGSVPTVHIAAHNNYQEIKGVVLISPIGSGIKMINPNIKISTSDLEEIDMFSNVSKVSSICCPVLLIHGMQDNVIPQSQSQEMLIKIRHVYEWFPRNGSHSNIITKYRSKFFVKVKTFLEHLNYSLKKSMIDSFKSDNYETSGTTTNNNKRKECGKNNENCDAQSSN